MQTTTAIFLTSLTLTFAIIKLNIFHLHITGDFEFSEIHKNHIRTIPRIGGLSIYLALWAGAIIMVYSNNLNWNFCTYLFACFPIFTIGLLEDLTKQLTIKTRFMLIVIFSFITTLYLKIYIFKVDILPLDYLLTYPVFSIGLTVFSLAGLTNSYNIIDGLNGLASMLGLMALVSIGILAYKVGDEEILSISLFGVAAILGFIFFNFPRGLIFLGDGGAYLIGFFIAILTILLITNNSEISPWVAILINIYPITETLFTIYRRKLKKNKNPGIADRLHLHSLLFKRLKYELKINNSQKNSITSVYIWLLSLVGLVPSILFFNSSNFLIFFTLVNILLYIRIYASIVNFRTNIWLKYLLSILKYRLKY
jgi:UDP-N-acetylmuramyl pentapeptide phosphotransferase/UDP-N-acetylglucosamine-1-phosphate transferase